VSSRGSSQSGRGGFRGRGILAGLIAAAAAAGAIILLVSPSGIPLPPIDLAGADPQVAARVEAARTQLREAPRSAGAWGELGMVLLAHDFFAGAAASFSEAGRLDRADPRWPYLEGLSLLKGNPEPAAALAALGRAAAISGAEPTPRLLLAETLIDAARLEEAEAQVREVLKRNAAEPRALAALGRIARQRGDLPAARAHLGRAAELAPGARAVRALFAEVLFRLGDREGAARESKAMAALPETYHWPDPWFAQVLQRWAGALARIDEASELFQRGAREQAIALLRRTVASHPGALLARLALGRFLLQAGEGAEAEQVLWGALEAAPDAFEASFELAQALELQEKRDEAVALYRRTLEIKPEYAPAHWKLGQHLLARGDRPGALAALRAAVRHRPEHAPAQRALGRLLVEEGRHAEARAALENALRLDPADASARALVEELARRAAGR
jgi:tetratricopeptide (TPR) repeat protein